MSYNGKVYRNSQQQNPTESHQCSLATGEGDLADFWLFTAHVEACGGGDDRKTT